MKASNLFFLLLIVLLSSCGASRRYSNTTMDQQQMPMPPQKPYGNDFFAESAEDMAYAMYNDLTRKGFEAFPGAKALKYQCLEYTRKQKLMDEDGRQAWKQVYGEGRKPTFNAAYNDAIAEGRTKLAQEMRSEMRNTVKRLSSDDSYINEEAEETNDLGTKNLKTTEDEVITIMENAYVRDLEAVRKVGNYYEVVVHFSFKNEDVKKVRESAARKTNTQNRLDSEWQRGN